MDRVRQAIRVRHCSRRTEEAYAGWIRRYLAYHRIRHPSDLDATHVSDASEGRRFRAQPVIVRPGKGRKDRVALLPERVKPRLATHLDHVRRQHEKDVAAGFGRVPLPEALDRKYPVAGESWRWQFVFPAARLCRDPRWGPPCRFHLHESAIQRTVAAAVRGAGITARASCHTFRHHADSRIMPSTRSAGAICSRRMTRCLL